LLWGLISHIIWQMNFIRFIFFAFYILAAFLGLMAVSFVLSFFYRDKRALFHRLEMIWCRYFFLPPAGITVECSGLENCPSDQPVIYIANHQSALDIAILLAYLPININFMVKSSLFPVPLLGWFIGTAGHIKIERASAASAYGAIKRVGEYLKGGRSVVIFPEGTRTRNGRLGEFKGGMLQATLQANVPIVPVAISGAFEALPAGHLYFRPATVKLTVGKPLCFQAGISEEEKIKQARETIASMLPPRP
jgi:1-acyl-sn-glycerol-3-phosphate acyltransferase